MHRLKGLKFRDDSAIRAANTDWQGDRQVLCEGGSGKGGPELTSHSVSGQSERVEVNLAGWDGMLRRGKGKEKSEKAIIKGRKKQEKTERTKWKNQR